jgi:hypothetical protein
VAVDVIIDPLNGQIYWNDNQNTAQSIAISGNATDKINFVGYSGFFAGTAGTAPADPNIRVTINDSASATLVPGTNGHELGSDTYRWAVSATTLSASGAVTSNGINTTAINTTTTPLLVNGIAGLTANYFTIKDSSNNSLVYLNSDRVFSIAGIANNQNDLLSITNLGSMTVHGGFGPGRGVRLNLRGSGTAQNDSNIFTITNSAGDHTILGISANSTTGYGMTLNSSSSGYPLSVKFINDATANTVKETISVERTSSATAANGIGSSIIFKTHNDIGALVRNLAFEGILESVVNTSYRGAFVFKTNGSGTEVLTEKVRISYNNILLSPYDSAGTYELRFNAQTGANYVGFKAPTIITSSVMWTLPSSVGTNGQFLKVGASGVLSWDTITAGTGTVTSIAAGTGLTGGTITSTGTIAIDTGVVPTLTATTNAFSSGNTTGSTTSSAFSLVANSVTTGTGAYFASSSLTSGKIIDIAMSGTAAANGKTGLYISAVGTHANNSISTYGIIVDNQSTGTSSANFGIASYAGAGTGTSLNIPLRLGLSTSKYVNFFVDAESGIRLSPQSDAFHFSLGPYGSTAGKTSELRFMELTASGQVNYVGFKAPDTIANNIIWTLPNVDGTTGQVLATNGTGTLSWATASGSVSVGGTNNGDIQYKSSTSLGGSANLNYDVTNNELKVLNYNPTNSASTAALKILTGTSWTGSGNGTLIAGNAVTAFTGNLLDLQVNAVSKFKVSATGAVTIANNYILPTSAPTSSGQVLTYDGTNVIWGTGGTAPVGSLTVNPGAAGKITYYPSSGDVVDDASALTYSTTGTHFNITASDVGVIPLTVTGAASQTAAIFKAILNTTDVFIINNSGNISTGTWNASAIGVGYGGTGQTTYTDGQLLIGNSSGNILTKSTITAGSGVAVTNGAGSIAIRQKRPLYLTFCAGFTPSASGVDSAVLRIPDSPADGTTGLTYNVRELFIRVETPSAGTSSVQVEYYTGTGAFSATGNMMASALSITGASTYESSTTTFSQATLSSGNKVRLNFTVLDGTHTNFFIQLLLEEN